MDPRDPAADEAPDRPGARRNRRLRLLVLGGTRFLGRHFVEAALAAGHHVVLFNRGRSNPDLFPDVEQVRGERAELPEALGQRPWDAVVDTSGHLPDAVRRSAEVLRGADTYLFVSSISAYAGFSRPGVTEDAPLAELPPGASAEEVSDQTFGPLKALCEAEVRAVFGDRALVVRPGLIVGPYDESDRFGYWVRRVAQGGRILAPGRPERPVQFIDARDLAAWMLRLLEEGRTGTFNATGPARPLAMEWLLETCRVESGRRVELVWTPEHFLLSNGVQPWVELPLWIPEAAGDHAHFMDVDVSLAREAGLTYRRILETVRDVRAYEQERESDREPPTLSAEREEELLEAWSAGG